MKAVVGVTAEPHRVVDDDGIAHPYRWLLGLPDRVAIEAALRTADEVVAVSIGGDRARRTVRSALEMGVGRGVHVLYDPIDEPVGEKYATVLARAAGRERPDAVFVPGSAPRWGSEVATQMAGTLGWPALTSVTAIGRKAITTDVDVDHIDTDETLVQRKLETGRQEVLAVRYPVVFSIDASYANPRKADLQTVVAGRRASVETVELESIAPSETRFSMSVGRASPEVTVPNTRWGRGNPPRTGSVEERISQMLGRGQTGDGSSGELVDAPPEEAAERFVDYLRANDLL